MLFYLGWDGLRRAVKEIIETEGTDLYMYLEEELQAENSKYKVCGAWTRNSKDATVAGVQ